MKARDWAIWVLPSKRLPREPVIQWFEPSLGTASENDCMKSRLCQIMVNLTAD
jgi:hypothetical protein